MPFLVPDAPEARAAAIKAHLAEVRAREATRLQDGTPATLVAAALAAAAEEVIAALWAKVAPAEPKVAVVALGSLGRRELGPYSDLDVVLVAEAPEHKAVRAATDGLFYPLWDARLEVGHGVRSPEDFAALVTEDAAARTAALDARLIAGSKEPFAALEARLRSALQTSAVKRALTQDLEAWLAEESTGTIYRLQPDVKSGPGGLREIQRVWWAARLIWRIGAWQDLLVQGQVGRHDLDALLLAKETLLRLRLATHFVARRRQDHLRFEVQDEVAAFLAKDAAAARGAPEALLRSFYTSAKAVRTAGHHVLLRCHEALVPPRRPQVKAVDDFVLFNGQLTVRDHEHLERAPLDVLRIFRKAQELGCPLYVHARERIAEAAPRLLSPELCATPEASRLFLDVVSFVGDGGRALELMHELGVLERVLPEFEHLTGLVQRDLYHTYTVDAHLIYCTRRALDLLAGRLADAPADFTAIAERLARPHLLVLGALFHDIGKGGGGGHSERGAVLAAAAAERWGLPPDDKEDLVFLVSEHLSLFKLSQRRDLEDPELLGRFAAKVETKERLDLLLLLSYVDATATGPEAWSDWKGALLRELYHRTREALAGGVAKKSLLAHAEARRLELTAALGGDQARLLPLVDQLSPRHLVSHRLELLVKHLEAIEAARRAGVFAGVSADARRGAWEVVTVGPDRAGLLASLAGELAAAGVSVDAAHIAGTTDGLVVDTFVVARGKSSALDDGIRQEAVARRLEAALRGGSDYAARLSERRRAAAALGGGAPAPEAKVLFDPEATSDATVVDVVAPDRVGLLHDLAQAIFEAGASIVLARVTTEAGRAVDAFYLVDAASGAPLAEPARDALARAVLAVVGPRS